MEQNFEDMSRKAQYKLLWDEYLGKREGAKKLMEWMEEAGFFESPASTKYHGSYPGGLCQHSLNVAFNALDLCSLPAFEGVSRNEAVTAALLHDLCKTGCYWLDDNGRYHYTEAWGMGHGTGSVILAQRYIKLTDSEQIAIRWHMGMYGDADKAGELANAYKKCPLAMLLHHADMMATYYGGEG